MGVNTSGGCLLRVSDTGIDFNVYGVSSPIVYSVTRRIGDWYHIAYTRSGTTGRLFYNGNIVGTTTDTNNYSATTPFIIGSNPSSGQYYTGFISNLRVVKGTAVYTSAFTPNRTTQLTAISGTSLLACQSNYFSDSSANSLAVTVRYSTPNVLPFSPFAPNASYTTANTGGALRFDGSGDYMDITDYANVMDLGGRAAHLEFWYYPTATGTQVVLGKSGGTADWGAAGFEYQLQYANSGTFRFYWNASGTPTSIDLVKPPGAWYHIVMASDASNNLALFVNGVRAGTGSNAVTKPGTRTSFRFGNDLSGNYATGIMSGLRFVSGNNAYSPTVSTITVPTVPPRNIANTVLLVNSTYGAIIDSTGKNIIETVADAKANNSLGKFLGSSMYFDGTGDEVLIPDSPYFDMGGGNFTVEFWFNAASARNCSFFTKRASNASYAPIMVQFTTSSTLILYVSTSGSGWAINQTSAATTLNTWHHCAMVRNGTSVVLYLDGVSVASGTMSGSVMTNSSQFVIGADDSAGNLPYQGHISDFRITRSARYTTTFTPPTKSFANR
jgi:hypothetical protein